MTLTAQAKHLIEDELKSGQPVAVRTIKNKAHDLGISADILRNARHQLGNVQTAHIGGEWHWKLLTKAEGK